MNKFTPKEKASFIVLKYMSKVVSMELAKECTLVELEGRMEELCILPYGMEYLDRLAYLEEIKEEINKL